DRLARARERLLAYLEGRGRRTRETAAPDRLRRDGSPRHGSGQDRRLPARPLGFLARSAAEPPRDRADRPALVLAPAAAPQRQRQWAQRLLGAELSGRRHRATTSSVRPS